jgi:spore coat polysaccharide biosynthesis predicted glycosyltransferase SpsG
MKIAIITDGNNTLGMGHIYQSRTLAGFLAERLGEDGEIVFITKSDEKVSAVLAATGCSVIALPDDEKIFLELAEMQPDRVVFDKLDVVPGLARNIREKLPCRLIIMTNITEASRYAHVVVLGHVKNNFDNSAKYDPVTGQLQLFGPRYWILRPEFYRFRKIGKEQPLKVQNIMLIFGGSDPLNFSTLATNTLLETGEDFNLMLVLGAGFEHRSQLDKVLEANTGFPGTVNVVNNMTNVAENMYNHDLVLTSPGLSFFEALVVGTPVIVFHQNEFQRESYSGIIPTASRDEIGRLPQMIWNREFVFHTDPVIQAMQVGEGKDELLDAILN